MDDEALERRIVKLMTVPARYDDYPAPIIYRSEWGYDRAKCPVPNCPYDGFVGGFNQHYTKKHAPENTRQIAKRIIKAVRETKHEQTTSNKSIST